MKKTVLFAAALFTVTAVSAQTGEITSARGENWLSQDGDWALTFSANPLLNYVGNLFNGSTNNSLSMQPLFSSNTLWGNPLNNAGSGIVIGGKKMIDANTAYRGKLRIGFGSDKTTTLVDQNPGPNPAPTFPNPNPTVENSVKNSYMAINLAAGIEKRVGSTRVVGIYGAELNVGFGSAKTTNEYGNALSNDTQAESGRATETKQGGVFGLGLNAFAGVEWFAAPKISLSGEYTWGLSLQSQGFGSTTKEYWVPTTGTAGTVTSITQDGAPTASKVNGFHLDSGLANGGTIAVNFYFQ